MIAASPKISIVLATYNGGKFLCEQLQSLINQTYTNIEIVAVDDGSTDNTIGILNSYATQYANFKIYRNQTNLGYVKNFEKGCDLAEGELIALCDQDDVWDNDKLKSMAEAIGDDPMVYCDSFICDENLQQTGKKISSHVNFQTRRSCLEISIFCRIYGNATLFKKSILAAAMPFPLFIPHDWWLSYVASMYGDIKYIDVPLVYYRQHSTNAVGAIGGKSRKKAGSKRERKRQEINGIRQRMDAFYNLCPADKVKEKQVLFKLHKSYGSFSLSNNLLRMVTFFRNYKILLYVKKRSILRQCLFCLKMFFMVK